jgi:hypothetical protein
VIHRLSFAQRKSPIFSENARIVLARRRPAEWISGLEDNPGQGRRRLHQLGPILRSWISAENFSDTFFILKFTLQKTAEKPF